MSTNTRQEGITNLIQHYQTKYNRGASCQEPNAAFFVHPAITFDENDGGVSVKATQAIEKGTTLLRLPQAERVSTTHATGPLKPLLQKIKTDYNRVKDTYLEEISGFMNDVYRHGDLCLAVSIMKDLADEQQLYTQAWPSLQDLEEHYYPVWNNVHDNWSKLLRGTYTLETLEKYDKYLRHAFDKVVLPILLKSGKSKDYVPAFCQGKADSHEEDLWHAFLFASSLIRSRSHEGRIPDEPEIIPLVDLINGYPDFCADKINVTLAKSFNSAAAGIVTSDIRSLRDIPKGEELIISYGDIRASACIIRYAYLPVEVMQNPQASLDVIKLQVPPFLAPPDALRVQACRQSGYPHTPELIQKDFSFYLAYDNLPPFTVMGQEPEQLKSCRQFLTICHLLHDEMVRVNIDIGRIRGNVSPIHLGQLLLAVLDYSVNKCTSLNETTNDQDLVKANSEASNPLLEAVMYRARVCQRDTYARWRHAFCRKYFIPSQHTLTSAAYQEQLQEIEFIRGPNFFLPQFPPPQAPRCFMESGGCVICGRTISAKACGKCKAVKYCGRDHQVMDWKQGHKQACKPTAAITQDGN